MLFWAVDNPAPANYLLISGDRDFSNALHQLRMRRYNILLAQPQKASAPLVAAAKSVWFWTSLLAGGLPLTKSELQQLSNNSYVSSSDTLQIPVSDPIQINQPVDSFSESFLFGNQKFPNRGRGVDVRFKGKQIGRNVGKPNVSRTSSLPIGIQEDQNNANSHQLGYAPAKQFREPQQVSGAYNPKAPLSGPAPNFIPSNPDPSWNNSNPDPSWNNSNPDPSWNNSNNFQSNYQNHYPQPLRADDFPMQPPVTPGKYFPPNPHTHASQLMPPRPDGPSFSSGSLTNVNDIGKLNISDHPSIVHNRPTFQQRNGEQKPNSIYESPNPSSLSVPQNGQILPNTPPFYHDTSNTRYPHGPELPPSSSSPMGTTTALPAKGIWGTPGCPKPSEYVQGLIGIVLLTLNTLKNEKIMPTEANIADCIRYGDPKHRNTDVKKALESAVEQQMLVKQNIGVMQLYVSKNERLWKCVNPIGGNPKQYPKATWDGIQKFLTSPAGRSAIMASQCR
ncbi:hypothetical protein L1049_019914 [Liquidambar formosana]|uniref:NYN domain-containing protein n=1 Tax=Liquidambar formosana TaxID=63359 RepID=A0AAP0SC16_LIQFO